MRQISNAIPIPLIKRTNGTFGDFDFILLFSFSLKIKSAATEVTAQKMQTPIVAKLTQCEMGAKHTQTKIEFAFLSNSHCLYAEIGTFIPKRKMHPISHLLS